MPANQRKLIIPGNLRSYELYAPVEKRNFESKHSNDIISSTYLNTGILTHVRGSAYIEFGKTKILVAVSAPREIKRVKKSWLGLVHCELNYSPTASKRIQQSTVNLEKTLSVSIRKAIEPSVCESEFNNFQVDIVVYVMQDDGCLLSTAINCVSAALADAGIPMYDLVSASTVVVDNEKQILNPSGGPEQYTVIGNEFSKGQSMIILSSLTSQNQITECYQIGYISSKLFKNVLSKLIEENLKMVAIIKQVLKKNIEKISESIET